MVFVALFAWKGMPEDARGVLGHMTLHIHDTARHRRFDIEVWYPVAPNTPGELIRDIWFRPQEAQKAPVEGAGLPIVMMSHGYRGTPESLVWLARRLVLAGYVVAAPAHHDPTMGNPRIDHWHRALDVSFALSSLLASPLAPALDPSRVGMVGLSLGGGTAVWLAGGRATTYHKTLHPGPAYTFLPFFEPGSAAYKTVERETDFRAAAASYRDPRLKAFVLLAPALGWAFEPGPLAQIRVPMLIATGDKDEELVPETNAVFFAHAIPGCRLEVIRDGGHYTFVNMVRRFLPQSDLLRTLRSDPGADRAQVHRWLGGEVCGFFDRALDVRRAPASPE